MLGCHERGGLTDPDEGTADPDDVAAVLSKLTMGSSGTVWDALWHFFLVIDPDEQEERHGRMIIQLARYARQSIEDLEQMELSDLQRYYHQLVKVVESEGAFTSASER